MSLIVLNLRTNVSDFCGKDALKGKILIYLPKIIAAIGLLSAGVWYVYFSGLFDSDSLISENLIPTKSTIEDLSVPTVTDALPGIFVHICGEVKRPSVYEVPAGSRVVDVINIAGGFTDQADTNYLNLARTVADSERIYVPALNEEGDYVVVEGNDKININSATLEELTTLPGIGEARAKDIISYRTNVGRFEKIEDIKNVSGIGDAMFIRMKSYISVR